MADHRELADLMSAEERREYEALLLATAAAIDAPPADASGSGSDIAPAATADGEISVIETFEQKQIKMRQRLSSGVDAIYQRSYDAYQKRQHFEFALHRTFFHVQPVEANELTTWTNYLTLEEAEVVATSSSSSSDSSAMPSDADLARLLKLYERCLIVCALYPAFWLRYAATMERFGQVSKAREVFERASTSFCKYSYVSGRIFLLSQSFRYPQPQIRYFIR
jgi:pre-mRNA-processing factor 39